MCFTTLFPVVAKNNTIRILYVVWKQNAVNVFRFEQEIIKKNTYRLQNNFNTKIINNL